MDPRRYVERLEAAPGLPSGPRERFSGYGIMGLPFQSGHVLAMRRFPASSIGPGYSAVWHRDPGGGWTFYSDVGPSISCAHYFASSSAVVIETGIHVQWRDAFRFKVEVPAARLKWEIRVGRTPATGLMSGVAGALPRAAWTNPVLPGAIALAAGIVLRAGRLGLTGRSPNGQRFYASPRALWAVTESGASIAGMDMGRPGPLRPQARLGDFWIPQRGLLVLGAVFFDAVHRSDVVAAARRTAHDAGRRT